MSTGLRNVTLQYITFFKVRVPCADYQMWVGFWRYYTWPAEKTNRCLGAHVKQSRVNQDHAIIRMHFRNVAHKKTFKMKLIACWTSVEYEIVVGVAKLAKLGGRRRNKIYCRISAPRLKCEWNIYVWPLTWCSLTIELYIRQLLVVIYFWSKAGTFFWKIRTSSILTDLVSDRVLVDR